MEGQERRRDGGVGGDAATRKTNEQQKWEDQKPFYLFYLLLKYYQPDRCP